MTQPIDIQSEQYREYIYPDGSVLRIDEPQNLYIFEGKSGWTQRVTTQSGLTYRPTPGWNGIRWQNREGIVEPFVL